MDLKKLQNMDMKQVMESLQSLQNVDMQQLLKKTDLVVTVLIIVVSLVALKVMSQKQTLQVEALKEKIKEVRTNADIVRRIEKSNKELESLKVLPVQRDFSDIIDVITDIAKSNDIEIISISQGTSQESESTNPYYYTLPLNFSMQGGYYNIWSFFNDIEDSEEFFTLEEIDIRGPGNSSRFEEDITGSFCSVGVQLSSASLKKE